MGSEGSMGSMGSTGSTGSKSSKGSKGSKGKVAASPQIYRAMPESSIQINSHWSHDAPNP